ncbi:MAG: YqaJ viral recombinase family protein [Gemmatimonadota bacterium]
MAVEVPLTPGPVFFGSGRLCAVCGERVFACEEHACEEHALAQLEVEVVDLQPHDRATWLEARATGVGGSDVAAVLGLDAERHDAVWAEKAYKLIDEDDTPGMAALVGIHMEPFIANLYAEQLVDGCQVVECPMLRDSMRPWMLANPDRLVVDGGGCIIRGLEIKRPTVFSRSAWDGQVPLRALLQCAWYMEITGVPEWDLAVLIGDVDLRIHRVTHDADLAGQVVDIVSEWWHRYVLTRTMPPPTTVAQWRSRIETANPVSLGGVVEATPADERVAAELDGAQVMRRMFTERIDYLKTLLQARLGSADRLVGDGWSFNRSRRLRVRKDSNKEIAA